MMKNKKMFNILIWHHAVRNNYEGESFQQNMKEAFSFKKFLKVGSERLVKDF